MDTIAFKRHDANKKTTNSRTSNASHTPGKTMQSGGINHKKSRSWPWVLVIVVLAVALTGLILLRFSRASEQGTAPLTAEQLQSYIQTQLIKQDQTSVTTPINVSKYAQFQFGSKITPAPAYVSWYVDNVPVARVSSSPFTFVWDSSRYSNGTHTLTAVAYDSNDQPLGATRRTIVIDNSSGFLQKAQNIVTYPWYWLFQL